MTMTKRQRNIGRAAFVFLVWIIAWSLVLMPEWTIPCDDGVYEDLSGKYVLNKEASCGLYVVTAPFVNYAVIENGSELLVSQEDGRTVSFSYCDRDGHEICREFPVCDGVGYKRIAGTLCWEKKGVTWNEGNIEYFKKVVGVSGILPSLGATTRRSKVHKTSDGGLQIDYVISQKSLVVFLIPLKEGSSSSASFRKCASVEDHRTPNGKECVMLNGLRTGKRKNPVREAALPSLQKNDGKQCSLHPSHNP